MQLLNQEIIPQVIHTTITSVIYMKVIYKLTFQFVFHYVTGLEKNELRHEKTNILHKRKQRRRSVSQ